MWAQIYYPVRLNLCKVNTEARTGRPKCSRQLCNLPHHVNTISLEASTTDVIIIKKKKSHFYRNDASLLATDECIKKCNTKQQCVIEIPHIFHRKLNTLDNKYSILICRVNSTKILKSHSFCSKGKNGPNRFSCCAHCWQISYIQQHGFKTTALWPWNIQCFLIYSVRQETRLTVDHLSLQRFTKPQYIQLLHLLTWAIIEKK